MTTCRWPAVPLIAVDPNFSVWSFTDHLAAENTRHWTGTPHPLFGLICVDRRKVAFCGRQPVWDIARQLSLKVDATTTTYLFEVDGVELEVRFRTPLLLNDLELTSRPASFVEFTARSLDGAEHDVTIEFGVSPLLAVNERDQFVVAEHYLHANGLETLRAGSVSQKTLLEPGDDRRIEWGHVHLFAPDQSALLDTALVKEWDLKKVEPDAPYPEETDLKREAHSAHLLVARFRQKVNDNKSMEAYLVVAYDDLNAAIEVAHRPVPGYWARHGKTFGDMLADVRDSHREVRERCASFDAAFNAEMEQRGGSQYRYICALAYRQSIAGHKLVASSSGEVEFHSKECFSNGCMTTVDVSGPSMPLFLRYNPELVKVMMRPVLDYARSDEWTFNFAPHDIGCYPKGNGQVYGRTNPKLPGNFRLEDQMPVEECGNMLIMFAAVARYGNDAQFADMHWDLVAQWAQYLIEFGVDPGEQLCTDDYSGHLAHNANLAVKAILGIGSYAQLCEKTGRSNEGANAWNTARSMVNEWRQLAWDDEAGCSRLAYDKPGTWSLKYNWVWDRLLGLDLFPSAMIERELASYHQRFLPYGAPLDNRALFTKSDWMLWCATLEKNRAAFDCWVSAVWNMLNDTPHRVPFTDWFYADTAAQAFFQNRTVQGGLFAPLLAWAQPERTNPKP